MTLLRSNIEFTKRVFLDRLTTDQQPLDNPENIDGGPGDEYVYANCGDSNNFGVGFDCSGLCGVVLPIAIFGPKYFAGIGYQRLFSTETFPGPLNGFRQTTRDDLVNGNYALKVMIYHGGGGPDSHMACIVDGIQMESNGDFGLCTAPDEITPMSYWNDFWVWDELITEDTTYRTPMSYPRVLDYTSPIPGTALKAANITAVCRYVTPALQWKCLQPGEFQDLTNNGIGVVFNFEGEADQMLNGHDQGVADAQESLNYIRSLPGVPANYQPVVYFSCDFDEAPNQDAAIFAYLDGTASVLGGYDFNGIYGGYWIVKRALDAGKAKYAWQTEAWSGGNVDYRVHIVQRNNAGYQYVNGVECDIDEAHSDDFGQFAPPTTTKGWLMALTDQQQEDLYNMVSIIFQQVAGIVPGLQLLPGSPTRMPADWPVSLAQVLKQ